MRSWSFPLGTTIGRIMWGKTTKFETGKIVMSTGSVFEGLGASIRMLSCDSPAEGGTCMNCDILSPLSGLVFHPLKISLDPLLYRYTDNFRDFIGMESTNFFSHATKERSASFYR